MPTALHEGPLELFRHRPELAPELLRSALGVKLPDYQEVQIISENLTQITPVERRADLVAALQVNGEPVLGIVLEMQTTRDEAKRGSWPDYVVALHRRIKCPVCLMVVAVDESIARWANRPLRFWYGLEAWPYVVNPDAVPLVDAKQATAEPELAVFSAMAHGGAEHNVALTAAKVAFEAALGLDSERVTLYHDLIFYALRGKARIVFEELMASGTYEYQSEFVRKYVAQGEARGKVLGRAEGEARGLAAGEVRSLLMFLGARRIALTSKQKQRIETCTNLELLGRWIQRAAVVTSAKELFAD
jgi:hypothetical protein